MGLSTWKRPHYSPRFPHYRRYFQQNQRRFFRFTMLRKNTMHKVYEMMHRLIVQLAVQLAIVALPYRMLQSFLQEW
jgi:hypothetical protein